jgi:hypothetical protein
VLDLMRERGWTGWNRPERLAPPMARPRRPEGRAEPDRAAEPSG